MTTTADTRNTENTGGQTVVAPSSRIAERARIAERRAAAMRLHLAGHNWQDVADTLGYASRGAACKDVGIALKQLRAEQDEVAGEYRAIELARLDDALAVCHRILHEEHVAHSGGNIVYREIDGQLVPLADSAPSLAAADRIVKISESRRKLLGLDAPVKQEISADTTVHYVVGVEAAELEQL